MQACSTEERRRDFEKIFAHYDVVSPRGNSIAVFKSHRLSMLRLTPPAGCCGDHSGDAVVPESMGQRGSVPEVRWGQREVMPPYLVAKDPF